MQSFKALFNKGLSAHELKADVFISGDHFIIKTNEEEILWPIKECSIELFGAHNALILCQSQKLKITKEIYLKLKKQYFKYNPLKDLVLRTLIVLLLVIGLVYQNQKYILNKIEKVIPNSTLEKQGELLRDIFVDKNCIDRPEKEALIKKIKLLLSIKDDNVEVIVSPIKDVNAIALPTNTIVFFNGLLKQIDHEDEMIAILAHEVGHVKLNHHRSGMAKMILFNFVWSLLTRDQADASLIKNLLAGSYTQVHEKEADHFAKKLLVKNNISLQGARDFMERLKKKSGVLDKITTSHPEYSERIQTFTLAKPIPRKSLLTSKEWKLLKDFCSK